MRVDVTTPEFVSFYNAVIARVTEHYQTHYKVLPVPEFRIEPGSKFIRIVVGGSVHAFVAREDSTTKALGNVQAGDVMKAATYRAPAKHARGNIFDTANGSGRMTASGPEYLI